MESLRKLPTVDGPSFSIRGHLSLHGTLIKVLCFHTDGKPLTNTRFDMVEKGTEFQYLVTAP